MFDQKKYNHEHRAERRKWMRENSKPIVGIRVIQPVRLLAEDLSIFVAYPEMVFYHEKRGESRKPYILFPTNRKYHVPLSLTKRVRLTINKNNNNVIARTEKCFKQ